MGLTRVLVVDDCRDYADSLALWLKYRGFQALACYSGAAALEAAATFQPHVALLDIAMPGMTGDVLAEEMQRLPVLAPVHLIAITGWVTPQQRTRCELAGFRDYLIKPLDFRQLEQALAMVQVGP